MEHATALAENVGKYGIVWTPDILMGVTRLSAEHELRVRHYLGLGEADMASAMARHPDE
jgi:hypothetical protein